MATPNDMQGWHKLPQELRLDILEFALTPPIEFPSPSNIPTDWLGSLFSRGVWVQKPKSLARNLLLVNKQFHNDVQHIIKYMPNTYHLDVMVVENYRVWFTWYLPKPPTSIYIDEVTVTFRIFDPPDDLYDHYRCSSNFTCSLADPTSVLHARFLRILYAGPRLVSEHNYEHFVIKKIDMNVLSGPSSRRIEDQGSKFTTVLFDYISSSNRSCCNFIARRYNHLVEGIVLRLNSVESQRLDVDKIILDMQSSRRRIFGTSKSHSQVLEEREEMKQRFEKQCHRAQIQKEKVV